MAFDNTQGYASVPVPAAELTGDLTDFSLLVDLSRLPADWWTAVSATGGSIRCSKDDGATELAYDLFAFDSGADTGWLRVKWASTLSSSVDQVLRIYAAADSGAGAYATTDPFGRFAAYDSNWKGYWPLETNGNDRLNAVNFTASGTPTATTGKVGGGMDFDDPDHYAVNTAALTVMPLTFLCWFNADSAHSGALIFVGNSGAADHYWSLECISTGVVRATSRAGTTARFASSTTTYGTGVWHHARATIASATSRIAHLDNGGSGSNATSAIPTGADRTSLARLTDSSSSNPFIGGIDEAQIHSSVRSDPWWAAEYSQSNSQAGFYGTITWVSAAGGGVNRRRRLLM